MGGSPVMSTSIFLTCGVILVFLLRLLASGRDGEDQARVAAPERTRRKSGYALQSRELVFRIFSPGDRDFVSSLRSPQLLRMYREERRKVALHWVRRTSREVGEIMRTHRLISRQSHNLNVATEAGLLLQYLELRSLCSLLVLLISIFGPHALNDLATYADGLYHRLARALPENAAVDGVAPSGNSAAP